MTRSHQMKKNLIMKKSILFLSFICFCISLSATDQVPDILIYKNQRLYIKNNSSITLDALPTEMGNNIRKIDEGYSTGCYRGYIATWTFENDSLFLTSIETFSSRTKISLEEYFPREVSSRGVFAHWFNHYVFAGTENLFNYYPGTEEYRAAVRIRASFKDGILQRDQSWTIFKLDDD